MLAKRNKIFQNKTFAEPKHLLLITRTKTDPSGQRQSVALPVIPPPNGEIFEGGYHVEKNPINGATTLVEPKKGNTLFFYLDT